MPNSAYAKAPEYQTMNLTTAHDISRIYKR